MLIEKKKGSKVREKVFVSKKLGNLIRTTRENRKWTQEQCAEEVNLSQATISRLELGADDFNKEIVVSVCTFLEIDFEKIYEEPQLINTNFIIEELGMIEAEMQEDPKTAVERFRELEQIYKHTGEVLLIVQLYGSYLRGKFYNSKGDQREAIKQFELAVHIGESYLLSLNQTNLLAASYYELSRTMNKQNQLQKAISYANQGIKFFDQDGDRSYVYYLLHIIKASILEKMSEYGQALSIVEKLWQERSYQMFSDCRLNLYQLKVELYIRIRRYPEAIPIALEGLQFARLENNPDRKFELMSSLGEVHTRLGSLSTGQKYYELAQKLEGKIANKTLIITSYTNLGEIYLQRNDLDNAKKTLEPLLKSIERMGEESEGYRLCKALVLVGEIYYQLNKYKKAKVYLESALELANEYGIDEIKQSIIVLCVGICKCLKLTELDQYIGILLEMRYNRTSMGGDEYMFHNDPPES
ncbi:helix-turn-helix domain-containing protein [Thermoactinomyces sp. DSM 45892]|uniref:helix-turn-helix domain-containing protein n=1 Tax=Thermoactinomyces sp. DSM 45892 TaxID=1882753 RepID=UPI000899891E|nr:helix-turn-helix domain-containing protein [Thermoactinomyces sp. DSM 45892]SDY38139.1 DNA-binding transcriptional regulator, XRE-family HTH domain [Thermoactinomyces sp. DSM 45892]